MQNDIAYKDKHFFEKAGLVLLAAGLVYMAWQFFKLPFGWDWVTALLLGFAPGGMATLLGEGLRTGRLGTRGGHIERSKYPFWYWFLVVFYTLALLVLLAGMIFTSLIDISAT